MSPTGASTTSIEEIRARALTCTRCRLASGRTQVVWGKGNLDGDVLFIGEAPGFHEDKQGVPFVGAAGQLLDRLVDEVGLDRTNAAVVNVLKCRPPNNRDPQPDEIEACTPYLRAQIDHMRPRVIVTLGNFATRFVLQQQIGITKARGQVFEVDGTAVIPTFHPAAALRGARHGGLDPVEAMRADLALVKATLASLPAREEPASETPSEQLGLF